MEHSVVGLMAREKIKSKAELARRCKIQPQDLNKYLKNKRRISAGMLETLCGVLKAQPGEILLYEPHSEHPDSTEPA